MNSSSQPNKIKGYNAKIGLIYRPFDFVRLGATIHSSTFFNLSDSYSYKMVANYDGGTELDKESDKGSFDYNLKTPYRAIGSVAFIIAKTAIISADYEFVDYRSSRLRSSSYAFFDENQKIQDKYKATGNLRTGVEIKLSPISLRAGYALYGNPYKTGVNNATRTNYTLGIGFRESDYFIDIAYVYSTKKENYYLYDPALISAVSNQMKAHSIQATVGFKF